ncbi:MAG TPA: FAD-binding oxidoreductase [Burkholderiaceae bacterium]|nr:FAD-binding oxidoreductase [Burkholderiaceae bacterium]
MIAKLQSLLRRAFMRVEALFNRAFGDRVNPLYHLGSMTFWLFWLVAGSGLYLYAFFETGVAGAYDSVQRLTHGQWYVGGILRSVHRYASDAMVLTMLLHMVRHFAFDRMRGWRWFTWVSGVALIWGVYVSGINGYMLPWDQLAQFVIVASFEWLDWLPGFGGALARNFLYTSSVNDRFFSLLAFMHIGLPLLVLLLMWVHVQRIPKASTSPPRPIMLSLVLTLLVLSLARPALSQGGAATLGVSPTELKFDWFYLTVFPLLYLWPMAQVWTLLVVATAVITAVPWLPLRWRRAGGARELRMTVDDDTLSHPVRMGETLLDAGLRAGLDLPYECRNGACGLCLCTVHHGSVDHGPFQQSALPESLRARGQTLMCCATPRSDVAIEVIRADGHKPASAVRSYQGHVDTLERLSQDLIRLTVSLPEGEHIRFKAGQYINIILDDGQRRAYSFANAPADSETIELHVGLVPGGRFTGHVFSQMKVGDTLRFEGPLGRFTLHESELPILFVAGATGFAPVKSIVEDAFNRGLRRPMWLYWGVRRRDNLYLAALAEQWQRDHDNFHFVPVLSEATAADDWTGRQGLVHEAMLADFPDMRGYEIYVCGSVKMVEAAVPAFILQGLDEGLCFSDAFMPSANRSTPTDG